jgi:hypothetical protein
MHVCMLVCCTRWRERAEILVVPTSTALLFFIDIVTLLSTHVAVLLIVLENDLDHLQRNASRWPSYVPPFAEKCFSPIILCTRGPMHHCFVCFEIWTCKKSLTSITLSSVSPHI